MVWSKSLSKGVSGRYIAIKCGRHESERYPRTIKDPASYGLVDRDYDSHHPSRAYPQGTEYQQAYCSNYAPPQEHARRQHQQQQERFQCLESQFIHQKELRERERQLQQQPSNQYGTQAWCNQMYPQQQQHQQQQHAELGMAQQCIHQQQTANQCVQPRQTGMPGAYFQPNARPNFPLYEKIPLPLVDKHYRGAHYRPDDPLGVQVPEELTSYREDKEGNMVRMSCREHVSNEYLPLYRYKDWVTKPEYEIWRDCNRDQTISHLPDPPTQFLDFYNQVRMGRPAEAPQPVEFAQCRVFPIPRDKDIPNVPSQMNYGSYNGYQMEDASSQAMHLCGC